jgi:WD40 repeat protein
MKSLNLFLLALTFMSVAGCSRGASGGGAKVTALPAGIVDQNLYGDMAFSPDGKTLAVANHDGVVKLCDLTSGSAESLNSPFPRRNDGFDFHNKIVYAKSGQFLAVAYAERAIVVRDVPGKKEKVCMPLAGDGVHSMAFTDGVRTLLALMMTSAKDARPVPNDWRSLRYLAVRFEVSSGKRMNTVDFGKYCRFEALSPEGRYAVLDVTSEPGVPFETDYHVFDVDTGKKLFQVGGMNIDPYWSVLAGAWVFSADGSRLFTCNQRGISIREVPSGKVLKHFEAPDIGVPAGASLSADGRLLAVISGRNVSLFNAQTGQLLGEVECHESASCKAAAISPDSRTMATWSGLINGQERWVQPVLTLWKIPDSW